MTETATQINRCAQCSAEIIIDCVWEPGGMNDYGGFIVQCQACDAVQEIDVGRDVYMSRVRRGAQLLDRYDRDVDGARERKRKKHGLDS